MADHKPRTLAGYVVVYKPDHFSHTLGDSYRGYVYEHRYKMECMIGRPLRFDEVVHHIDGNKLNNDINNLALMTRRGHTRLHAGCKEENKCLDCGKVLKYRKQTRCMECSRIHSRKVPVRPDKETLEKMIEETSYCEVARRFGVSDNAIRKWMNSYV